MLVWLINAGGFATIVAYLFVPMAFLALRRNEPDMERPFKVPHGIAVGRIALLLASLLLLVFLPWSPAALIWPYEWLMVLIWSGLGLLIWTTVARHNAPDTRHA